MLNLRHYQTDQVGRTREALAQHQRVVLQASTGAGKTAMAGYMVRGAQEKKRASMFVVHRNKLVRQTHERFLSYGIGARPILAGQPFVPAPCHVASLITLANHLSDFTPPKFLVIDEGHRGTSKTYRDVLDWASQSKAVFLTATPERTDGTGLIDVADAIVAGLSTRELINQGYLADYELYSLPMDIELSAGEQYGDLVAAYKKYAYGEIGVVMCTSIRHAEDIAAQYQAAGVNAQTIHSGVTEDEQDAILERFTNKTHPVLCQIDLLTEGLDIPEISWVQWARKTDSLIIWLQGNGRGFRPAEGKGTLKILDHMGNYDKHGAPCMKREWSLYGKERREAREAEEAAFNARQCNSCGGHYTITRTSCPYCGACAIKKAKPMKVLKGELRKIEVAERKQDLITLKRFEGEKGVVRWYLNNSKGRAPAYAAMFRQCRGKFDKAVFEEFQQYEREIRSE